MVNITIEETIIFERLIMENRDNARLQKISECGYLESILILNKLRKKLSR